MAKWKWAINKISTIIKGRYPEMWIEWKEIPIEHKTMWFENFKTKCKWDGCDHEDIVRIWKWKSANTIRTNFSEIRREKSRGTWLGRNIHIARGVQRLRKPSYNR